MKFSNQVPTKAAYAACTLGGCRAVQGRPHSFSTVIDCGAILFDLDGTLVDSSDAVARTWTTWASIHQLDPNDVFYAARGKRPIDTIRHFAPSSNLMTEVARLEAIEISELDSILALPGAYDIVEMIAADKWAVVSSGSRKLAQARIATCAFPRPPVVIGSEDVGRGKPDPEPYIAATIRLGVAPEDCMVFEDTPAGIQSAKTAGCTVVALTTTHAAADLKAADGMIPNLSAVRVQRKDGRLFLTLRH